ncbi:hypothetical protein NDU88_003265 [Pleurodeles waltl]|uniref:Uncharacterized protein n=1 Tax=Pleurodeles waltl TaxID=8319 RepID=A0AAV7P9E6_PLEWA|nr:hypothetical protein NDU88_003265 [Pleurodeles waltl]
MNRGSPRPARRRVNLQCSREAGCLEDMVPPRADEQSKSESRARTHQFTVQLGAWMPGGCSPTQADE